MKKRYMFTLTRENVETFQALTKQVGLPPATLSTSIDGFIKEMNSTIQKCVNKGTFTLTDLFTLMGEQLELIQEKEEGKNEVQTKPVRKVTRQNRK